MNADFDVAIVGSGFAGSLMAMVARRLGRSVTLLERGRHPRFAIGESSTPLANLLLEELAVRHDLPALATLSKWGTWQRHHPGIRCGLKRGFTFYHHRAHTPWTPQTDRSNELLVAASPHDGVADTHWFRADFDQFLAAEARRLGAELLEETRLDGVQFSDEGATLSGERAGRPFTLRARFVVDASGARGFLARALGLPETPLPSMPATAALFSHFEGVQRWDALHPCAAPPPYPVDDAALHHVFEGGWMWVLRFGHGVTSAGVAATRPLADSLNLSEGEPGWRRLLERFPSLGAQFGNARAMEPFVHTPQLSFRCAPAAGPGWALLPSAAGFVDPLLSTGFPLTLLGIHRLSRLLEAEAVPGEAALKQYSELTLGELDAAATLIGGLYACLDDFELFRALSLLYFGAASYAETVRRLGQPERAGSFLLHREQPFGRQLRDLAGRVGASRAEPERTRFLRDVQAALDPINVAGLGDPARRHWYPALASDLMQAAPRLGVEAPAMERLLRLFEPDAEAAPARGPATEIHSPNPPGCR